MKHIIFNNDRLSKLSLGTVQFGLDYGISNNSGQPSQKDVDNIVQYVYDNNINCFDTAQAYGNSESVLG
ncbi:aldo/keto reductase, partial [Sulfurimonas sp. SAG-AH-194-I05]